MQINAEQTKRQESTDVLPHIYPWADKTHIHRPSGWGVGGDSSGCVGILLTWCQGLNSVGSASRRQQGLAPFMPLYPRPTPPRFSGTLNSTVWTPLSNISTLWAPSTTKNVFFRQCYRRCYLDRGGPQGERAVKTGTSFLIQLAVHLPEPSYYVFMCHSFFLKLQRD